MPGLVRDLGPCRVLFNGVDLGETHGGVIFRSTEESRPVNTDQAGITEVDGIKVGASCSVEVNLTRTALANLATIIGGASYSGALMQVFSEVGYSMYDNAQALVIKPVVDGVASITDSEWLTVNKAYPQADLELSYNLDGQRVFKTMFKGFPDASTNELWRIGA